jgi:hypothetical protein
VAVVWFERWQGKVRTEDDCVAFVDDVGFCTINRKERNPQFPNVADAMGLESALGETWFWKDDLHIQKRLYYTRLFFNMPGYISLELLPAFIATNGQVADELIVMGQISSLQRTVYDTIDKNGPIPSKDLRRSLAQEDRGRSSEALITFEKLFIATKTNLTGRTRHTYGYVWDLAERWVPWAFEQADKLGTKQAREMILEKLHANGVEPEIMAAACGW